MQKNRLHRGNGYNVDDKDSVDVINNTSRVEMMDIGTEDGPYNSISSTFDTIPSTTTEESVAPEKTLTVKMNFYRKEKGIKQRQEFLKQAKKTGGCPDNWITYNRMCYSFNTTKLNWFHAAHACKEQGAWLVDIHSKDEDSFLKSTINRFHAHDDPQNVGYWTSGNDLEVEGQWVWGYEATSSMAYTDWFPGEPNNSWYDQREEDCVVLWGHDNHGYQWNDQPCDITDFFVCKKEDSSTGIIG